MRTMILKQNGDLTLFSKLCAERLNLHYPLEFLQQTKVRAFFDHHDEMIGGYILNYTGTFRVIESLPEEVRGKSEWTKPEILDKTYEITGLWLDKNVTNMIDNFLFWMTMYTDMVLTRRQYLVYAYDLDKTYLKELYSIMNPRVIFSGETIMQKGMSKACAESVEIAKVSSLRFGLLYKWDFFLKKLFIPRRLCRLYGISLSMRLKTFIHSLI